MPFNVLIVDDSPAMRSFIRRVLDLSGFPVGICAEASDGQEALDLLRGQSIDVILTDINMPRMDGEEFLRRRAQDPHMRSIPALVISTDRTASRVHRMLALGASGDVQKPFAAEGLREELERALGACHARS
jgi:two-component system chemotaxis response regulator CheY